MNELNALTRRLYEEGYTRENHPDYVYWGDYQNFAYKWEHLCSFVWETPCGLLINGSSAKGRGIACGDASFRGIWYCPENDNPLVRCPYDKKGCPSIPDGYPLPLCPCHQTQKPYDYDQSLEKVEDQRAKEVHRKTMEITGGAYCACVVGGNGYAGGTVEVDYDVFRCISFRCPNDFCVIRKCQRDLSKVNIFYDIRRTFITRIGFLEERRETITKGVKVFQRPVARTDAEIWLREAKDKHAKLQSKHIIENPAMTPEDRRMEFFSKMHRKYGNYDYFEFFYDVENIRIARSDKRDLLQDLKDAAEGIEVHHAIDLDKAAAARKKEQKEKRQLKKEEQRRKLRYCLRQKPPEDPEDEQLTFG